MGMIIQPLHSLQEEHILNKWISLANCLWGAELEKNKFAPLTNFYLDVMDGIVPRVTQKYILNKLV